MKHGYDTIHWKGAHSEGCLYETIMKISTYNTGLILESLLKFTGNSLFYDKILLVCAINDTSIIFTSKNTLRTLFLFKITNFPLAATSYTNCLHLKHDFVLFSSCIHLGEKQGRFMKGFKMREINCYFLCQ